MSGEIFERGRDLLRRMSEAEATLPSGFLVAPPTREIPILFQDTMVRAILDGRKTVTRRVGKSWAKAKPGDILWVREAWAPADRLIGLAEGYDCDPPKSVVFRADHHAYICNPGDAPIRADDRDIGQPAKWRPSIHMPRWACRLTLRIVDVDVGIMHGAVPRLSADEARREGFDSPEDFYALWRKMHGDEHRGALYRVAFERLP